MSSFHHIIGRALSDEAFCDQLVRAPEATLRATGVEPTPEMIKALSTMDSAAVRRLATAFGQSQAA